MLDRGILFNSSRSSGYFSLRRTSRPLFRIPLLRALFSIGYFSISTSRVKLRSAGPIVGAVIHDATNRESVRESSVSADAIGFPRI